MTGGLGRVASLLVGEPAAARVAPARPRPAPTVVLLCPPGTAGPEGAMLALGLRRAACGACALLIVWEPDAAAPLPPGIVPAARPARRLAASLACRGIDADAAGRLVRCVLEAEPGAAMAAAARASAAADGAPVVIALAGPRPPAADALLARCDLAVVAAAGGSGGALGRLACSRLAERVERVVAIEPAGRPVVGRLALAGLDLGVAAGPAVAAAREAIAR